jgi:glycosyltransferase involved in cell wall biosynthesis
MIIEPGRTGWLVEDEAELTETLVAVVDDEAERARRGDLARQVVCERFSWPGIATSLASVMEDVLAGAHSAPAIGA